MRVLYYHEDPARHASSLMIMLPGALQDPEEFRHTGFVDALRGYHPDFDVALVDPALQFIGDAPEPDTVRALHDSVVRPALANYSRIWMTGISLGGFLALSHAACYPGQLKGLCLLAPYPGTRMRRQEPVLQEGTPASPDGEGGVDLEQSVWHWLRCREQDATRLWLGYGAQDRFADGLRKMEKWMPQQRAEVIDGGHDWDAWQRLWDAFLRSDYLRQV